MKQDRRVVGGLNNQKFPLRKVVRKIERDDLKTFYGGVQIDHELECGHTLPAVSSSYVRHRRCYQCGNKAEAANV
jgi:hypothetical protein